MMFSLPFLAAISQIGQGYLTETVALAIVALIGYVFGKRTRRQPVQQVDEKLHRELSRATAIAKELQQITQRVRQDVASHQSNIAGFNSRVREMRSAADVDGWQTLSSETEALLAPTMKLATKLSSAYDQLRKQSMQLMNFAESRTDPLTGVHNRRALEEQLEVQFSLRDQNDSRFSLSLFSVDTRPDVDSDDGHSDNLLCAIARLLENGARDTDLVARYGGDEFVVLMPQTSLAGATVFGERFLRRVRGELDCIVHGGIVEIQSADTPQRLLSRADSALYSARAQGLSCLYQHNGQSIRLHETNLDDTTESLLAEPEAVDTTVCCMDSIREDQVEC